MKFLLFCTALAAFAAPNPPQHPDSFRLLVIGDSGTADREMRDIAAQTIQARKIFSFDHALMLGDNIYGSDSPRDLERKFAQPYKPLLDAGVQFHAILGNHDHRKQVDYKPFGMNGKRYYSFEPKKGIRFFALDSNYMDPEQLKWFEEELKKADKDDWKICLFHHPIYSSGARHGPSLKLREALEPLLIKYNVSLALSGHEHFYERLKPQNGVTYIISGAAAKLRKNGINKSDLTAKGFDTDRSFMLLEIAGDTLYFQAISRTGDVIDSGTLSKR